jgi:protein gp37
MSKSKIEWTDRVWNPVTGCTKISPGCDNCYAERMAHRLAHIEGSGYGTGVDSPNPEGAFNVKLRPERIEQPLRWKKPSKIFVCSMGDLFHDKVPFNFINDCFFEMEKASQHIFLVLTKRPKRMAKFFGRVHDINWPYKNVWLGVTAENQQMANERIPILLQIPAVVRFVSVEPMLGPVNLMGIPFDRHTTMNVLEGCGISTKSPCQSIPNAWCNKLDWVICGGESGPGARPMHPDWARGLRDQCQAAGVPFFFKQWGEWAYPNQMPDDTYMNIEQFGNGVGISDAPLKVGKKRAGRLLDGRTWDEFPLVDEGREI